MVAATQDTVNVSTGPVNGRNVAGDINNTPYFTQISTVDNSIQVVEQLTGLVLTVIKTISTKVLAAVQADFATAPYVAMSIGTTLSIVDYKASGFGFTVQKTSIAAGTFADWMILSTDDKASTGGTGTSPIA